MAAQARELRVDGGSYSYDTEPPTVAPTVAPTESPTDFPTASPTTDSPTETPVVDTDPPTTSPTASPTTSPTDSPTQAFTFPPTLQETLEPTVAPTVDANAFKLDMGTAIGILAFFAAAGGFCWYANRSSPPPKNTNRETELSVFKRMAETSNAAYPTPDQFGSRGTQGKIEGFGGGGFV
jgi:hypothetical protein